MLHAWAQYYLGHRDVALDEAKALLDTDERADAHYLAARVLIEKSDPSQVTRGRVLMARAFVLYTATLNHAGMRTASNDLAGAATEAHAFDESVAWAHICVVVAGANQYWRGIALRALASAHDIVGRANEARAAFAESDELLKAWPRARAWTRFKRGVFLLELHRIDEVQTALGFLEPAMSEASRTDVPDDGLARAVVFNLAAAYSALGHHQQALASLPRDLDDHPMIHLISAAAAAQDGKLDDALAHVARARASKLADNTGYAIDIGITLAQLLRRQGRVVEAEGALREAIEEVEKLRQQGAIEIRSWILDHHAIPYHELVDLLLEGGRQADALVVMEMLNARAWRDAVGESSVSSDAASLLAQVGDREALVFLVRGSRGWRAHVAAGKVHVEALSAEALEAATAFRRAPDDVAIATRAAELLLPRTLIESKQPLHLVVSADFADVPFAALRRGSRLLIEDRDLVRLPGLAARRCVSNADGPPVFIGDARADGDKPLPAAADEVRALADKHGVTPYLDEDATRAAVLGAGGASLLYMAVHGRVKPDGGTLSLHDGPISVADVRAAHLAPAVVFLAGCETAIGSDSEGWDAFPSAFLANGSRHVIAATRPVDDDATAAFSVAFQRQPETLDPAARLAAAQRAVAGQVRAAVWASFVVWGAADCAAPAVVAP